VVKVRGDADHPLSHGYTCAKAKKLNAALDFLGEAPEVILHPDDAAAAEVVDGHPVVVSTARGSMTGVAKVDASIRRGSVSVPHGHHGANVNLLTDKDDIDVVTGMVRYAGVAVAVSTP
jgi:anaerobic selenocysteine-containing dehydrogenase